MHNLLKRQIKRFFNSIEEIPAEWQDFINAIDQAYIQFDNDREMLERSLDLSSQELLQVNSELRAILSAIPDLFFRLDSSDVITYHQAGNIKDLILPATNLVGKRIQDLPFPEVGNLFEEAIEKVRKTEEMVSLEYSLIIENEKHYYEARFLPLVKKQTIVIIRNITELKNFEKTLIDEKERLAVTLRSIGDGVITTDINGNIELINTVAEKLTGWEHGKAAGRHLCDVFDIKFINKGETCEKLVDIALNSKVIIDLRRAVLIDNKGGEKTIEHSAAPIKDQDSKTTGAILVFRDITEKLKLEEEILKRQKLESIGILAGGIAHDFNNILNAIFGSITIAKIEIGEKAKSYTQLSQAETALYRARNLTHQLLTFSKGGMPVKETAHLDELLQETTKFVLSGSKVRCDLDIASDLLPVQIDKGQISQVINNLVINAVQAMPGSGTIYIKADNFTGLPKDRENLHKGKYVKISFRDEGIGISKKDMLHIFDPYFSTKEQGSGLGLATSYSIINKHDGFFEVESEPGKGSVFSFCLPVSGKETVKEAKKIEPKDIFGKGHILLMDDEKIVRDVAGDLIRHLGYEVKCTQDGAEAIRAYKKALKDGKPFDAVIMDLTVPGGIGGKEAINALLDIDPDVVAIVSSGYSHNQVMAKYKSHGFKDILRKPYSMKELSITLSRLLKDSQ